MQVFTVSRYTTSGLTKAFQAAVAGLPKQANSESDIQAFRDFFDDFGTHYLRSAAFGGYFTIKTEFTESLLRSYDQRDLRAAVDASYKGVVSSGRMSADAAYGSSQLLSQNRSNAIVDVYHTGGTPDDDTNKFFKSLFENPTLLLIPEAKPHVRLEPIYKLLDVDRQQPAKSALETYTALDFDELPPAMSVPFETAAQATTDGFIFGGIDWSAHGDRAFLSVYSDSIRNTATRRASASIHYWDKAEEWIRYASLFTPIRRGDYYKSQLLADGRQSDRPRLDAAVRTRIRRLGADFGRREREGPAARRIRRGGHSGRGGSARLRYRGAGRRDDGLLSA